MNPASLAKTRSKSTRLALCYYLRDFTVICHWITYIICSLDYTCQSLLFHIKFACSSARATVANLKKGSSSSTEYLQHIKSITDNLVAVGSPIEDGDVVYHILHGLPSEYNAFITSIRIREPPVTADNLLGLLLCEELSIEDTSLGTLERVSELKAFQANMKRARLIQSKRTWSR